MGFGLNRGTSPKFGMLASFSAALLFAFLVSGLFPYYHHTDDSRAANVPSTTTLSMTSPEVSMDLHISNVNGTFVSGDPAEFTVATNNYTGYTLTINAKTDDANSSKLLNGSYVLNSISAATPDATGFSNGSWGYKPNMLNSQENTNYLPAPDYAGDVIDVTNGANSTANEYNIVLAAKSDMYQPSGNYTNDYVIRAIANPVNYTISYNKNTTDYVGNMPEAQTGEIGVEDIKISNKTPTRTNYVFIGWCNGNTTTTNNMDQCTGTVYSPDDVYVASMQTQNTVALKAMWKYNLFTVTYDFSALNNMSTWNKNYSPSRSTVTYASKESYFQVFGESGWEIVSMPITVKTNVEYTLSFTAIGDNIHPLSTSYGGAGVSILTSISNDDCQTHAIATTYITPGFNGTKTLTFTPTTSTVYLALNMGMLSDNALSQFHIGNFKLSENILGGATLTKIPTLSPTSHTFNGYYTAESGGSAVSNSTIMPAANTTYYARATATNSYTMTYDFGTVNNMGTWSQNMPATNTITYSNKESFIKVTGVGGWELVYMPIAVKTNTQYTLTFTAKGDTIYPLSSSYGGAGVEILTATSNSDCLSYSIATTYITPGFNGTKTLTFTPTTNTVYLTINMGMLTDGKTSQFHIGNFKLSESMLGGTAITKIPTLTPSTHNFNGYFSMESGGVSISNTTLMPAANVTYYARSTAK